MFLKIPDFTTVRLQDWWMAKAANLLAVVYSIALITALPLKQVLPLLAAALVTIVGIGGFGHVVNDIYDIPVDAAAGKSNRLSSLTPWKRLNLVIVILAIALVPWLILPFDRLSIAILLVEFGLLIGYAIPPLRLKQRGIWAICTDAAYAYALPALLAAHTFFLAAGSRESPMLATSLLVWQMALGVRHFLNHLALDRANDIRSGISTLATIRGNRYIHILIRHVILPIELLGFLGYLLLMNEHAHLLPLVVGGIFIVASSFHITLAIGRNYPLLTYRFSKTQLDWLYQIALPLVLLSYLVALDFRFIVLLFAHMLLFASLGKTFASPLSQSFDPAVTSIPKGQPHRETSSVIGGVAPSLSPPANSKREAGTSRVNIAVVNINKYKYTETFIRGLVSRLQYNVSYLYGDDLPCFDDDDRHFLSNWPSLQALAQFIETVLRLEENTFLKSSICSYLQAKSIKLLLAEFGPVGNQMLPIARDLGIPLIVYFHGYDIFNRETLKRNSAQYPDLFRGATCIIGVSEIMLNRLEELGAPREKLLHLPAFVNLELFPYCDHGSTPLSFLAVGRFSETKSPHITLLAFHQVCRVFPEATLTMVGKGGGGELFEACLILAKALGLEHKVVFKGVINHQEVAAEMRRARVFVQHSVTTPEHADMEGKPVAIMEAMASGLPVVATRHSGILELIEDGVSGLLVEEYDVAAMAAAMIRLAQDENLARQIGERGSAFIHNHPLISRHVEIMESILDRTIAES
jgi:colanic acid/amylovoran biosynthesis glycosyltransferase